MSGEARPVCQRPQVCPPSTCCGWCGLCVEDSSSLTLYFLFGWQFWWNQSLRHQWIMFRWYEIIFNENLLLIFLFYFRMCMTAILLFIWALVRIFGSKKCPSYLIHSLSWQKGCSLQALMMSLTILQNIICWKRKVSSMYHVEFTFPNTFSKLQGTHAQLGGRLYIKFSSTLKWAIESGKDWYRSKEPVPITNPFVGGGYLSNKKWPLIEECIYHTVIDLVLRARGQLKC